MVPELLLLLLCLLLVLLLLLDVWRSVVKGPTLAVLQQRQRQSTQHPFGRFATRTAASVEGVVLFDPGLHVVVVVFRGGRHIHVQVCVPPPQDRGVVRRGRLVLPQTTTVVGCEGTSRVQLMGVVVRVHPPDQSRIVLMGWVVVIVLLLLLLLPLVVNGRLEGRSGMHHCRFPSHARWLLLPRLPFLVTVVVVVRGGGGGWNGYGPCRRSMI